MHLEPNDRLDVMLLTMAAVYMDCDSLKHILQWCGGLVNHGLLLMKYYKIRYLIDLWLNQKTTEILVDPYTTVWITVHLCRVDYHHYNKWAKHYHILLYYNVYPTSHYNSNYSQVWCFQMWGPQNLVSSQFFNQCLHFTYKRIYIVNYGNCASICILCDETLYWNKRCFHNHLHLTYEYSGV